MGSHEQQQQQQQQQQDNKTTITKGCIGGTLCVGLLFAAPNSSGPIQGYVFLPRLWCVLAPSALPYL
jgi:hypothetical protein